MSPVPPPQRILLVRLSHLGDVVHALPVFHGLRRAHPGAEIGWAIQPEFAPLLEGLPGLERRFLFDRRGGARAWLRLRGELRAWRPDWSVDAQGNSKSAAVAWISGAPRRLGMAREDWREPLGARFLHERARVAEGPHAVQRMLALRKLVAGAAGGGSASFELGLSAEERAEGERTLAARMRPGAGRRWILHLGVGGDRRSWPTESWEGLARHLSDAGEPALLLSGPREADVGEHLARSLAASRNLTHWVGQRGLRPLAAFLGAAAAHALRMVTGDSGPCHVAAAVGLPVDLLAGPQDPERTGPWPPAGEGRSPHRILRAPGSAPAGMQDLSVERVVEVLFAD